MKYIVTINNKNYEVEVEQGQASIVKTIQAAQSNPAVPSAIISPSSSSATATVPTSNGELLKAPMPGIILNCKVTSDTKVKKGDVIFILEAMKMENEIVAPIDGVVVQIIAAKGSTVSTGDVLAVIQ